MWTLADSCHKIIMVQHEGAKVKPEGYCMITYESWVYYTALDVGVC